MPGSAIKFVFNLLCFAAATLLTAAVLGRFTEAPQDPLVGGKLAWWQAHGAEFDTLIIGTSRTFRGIIPGVFDETMAAAGEPARSFNLAADGMRPPEDDFVLEKALAVPGLKLRRVIVECNEVQMSEKNMDHPIPRDLYWHDAQRLRILWKRAWATPFGKRHSFTTVFSKRLGDLELFAGHTRLWLWKSLHIGEATAWVRADGNGAVIDGGLSAVGPRQDGSEESRPLPPMSGKALADYQRTLNELTAHTPPTSFGDPESQADLVRKRTLIESVGAQMILVRPPYLDKKVFAPSASLARVPFFDCSDPARFPQLYALEMRHDYGHTNARGSAIYTRLLAEWLREKASQ